ncbi:siderophore-interacting protein [Streptomyces sp. HNM0663]|uniref:Siderophore-interacting protein n=1 Tax=Streptomyces chengmaiensis TaxID=3040919 RepID=A0ABT6HGY2_9ACTN|nr:siderophore-interacting protein [Streptomyces chengmaiensis]MDH2388019.1 siderophore-interacting protein [Streptomyces chengmaiensis]
MGHGWQGAVLKLMRGKDFTFTVRSNERISERLHRLCFDDGGMLQETGVHPTMWVRLWFDNGGRPHQRAYTLVDPDPVTGAFSMDFVLHPGCASDWARAARPGDTIEATVQGSQFSVPDPAPSRLLVVGDAASRPAIDSLLDAMPLTPAVIWYETSHPRDDEHAPRGGAASRELIPVPRRDGGGSLVEAVHEALPQQLDDAAYVWIACDTATTRGLAAFARKQLGVPRERLHALGYWRAA